MYTIAHITEPSNNDYDNDVSNHNFSTFDDFGVKNDQKVSHNMILGHKGQHDGKKGNQIRARPPPLFEQCPKEIDFFPGRCSLTVSLQYYTTSYVKI